MEQNDPANLGQNIQGSYANETLSKSQFTEITQEPVETVVDVKTISEVPVSVGMVDDPLAPDAPIFHLLSLLHNPLVKNMSTEELQQLVQRCRTLATSAPSLSSKLQSDSDNVNPRKRTDTKAAQRKAALADL